MPEYKNEYFKSFRVPADIPFGYLFKKMKTFLKAFTITPDCDNLRKRYHIQVNDFWMEMRRARKTRPFTRVISGSFCHFQGKESYIHHDRRSAKGRI
ncbi:hypothetical protein BAXH7_00216 [Bacillus amyloliquefaciens XH7]|nr:hypothetical protein BAXH7_00216 [Bacillus amyloliquefaciens XH7]QDP90716.1 hypothetical protein FOG69_00720 [Bacillus amyloliquefaciens]